MIPLRYLPILLLPVSAQACDQYGEITDVLNSKFRESQLFAAYSNSTLLEFWGSSYSWSIIRRDAISLDAKISECAKVIANGTKFRFYRRQPFIPEIDESPSSPKPCFANYMSSFDRQSLISSLAKKNKQLAIAAKSSSGIYEIFTSPSDWTVVFTTQEQNMMSNSHIPEYKSCSKPIAAGKKSFLVNLLMDGDIS